MKVSLGDKPEDVFYSISMFVLHDHCILCAVYLFSQHDRVLCAKQLQFCVPHHVAIYSVGYSLYCMMCLPPPCPVFNLSQVCMAIREAIDITWKLQQAQVRAHIFSGMDGIDFKCHELQP